MTQFSEAMEFEADDMMDGILDEASGAMSPTLTPFVSLGTSDDQIMDGPTDERQTKANDLFQSFDEGDEQRLRRSGLYRVEEPEL